MTTWDKVFARLDALSRTRALTEMESELLERAMKGMGLIPESYLPPRIERWAEEAADAEGVGIDDIMAATTAAGRAARQRLVLRLRDARLSSAQIAGYLGREASTIRHIVMKARAA